MSMVLQTTTLTSSRTQIRISKDGILYLSEIVGNEEVDGLAFRLETFIANNGYIGLEAAKDEEWIKRLYDCLSENWPNPSSTYIDDF